LFILEGIPAILLGIMTIFYLTDWPSQAKWLPADEREWITEQLLKEKQAKQQVHSFRIGEALRHRDVVLLTLCYFCALTGGYGVSFWLPTILKRLSGLTDFKVTLLAALPYLAGFISQQINGWHSDLTSERRWHAAIPIFCCGASLLLAVLFRANIALSVAMFTLMGAGYFAFHPGFWPIPTQFLSESAAAAGIGMINSVGNLGGFVGPMIMGYLVTRTKSFAAGMLYLVGSLFLSSVLMLLVKAGRGNARLQS
jgi:ACS family tartrate transporter-like MFS transporter